MSEESVFNIDWNIDEEGNEKESCGTQLIKNNSKGSEK